MPWSQLRASVGGRFLAHRSSVVCLVSALESSQQCWQHNGDNKGGVVLSVRTLNTCMLDVGSVWRPAGFGCVWARVLNRWLWAASVCLTAACTRHRADVVCHRVTHASPTAAAMKGGGLFPIVSHCHHIHAWIIRRAVQRYHCMPVDLISRLCLVASRPQFYISSTPCTHGLWCPQCTAAAAIKQLT